MKEGSYIEHIFGDRIKEFYSKHNGWYTFAVHHSIPWPQKDVLIKYNGSNFFLRGLDEIKDRNSSACISMRKYPDDDFHHTLKQVYKFSSILGWFKEGYVDIVGQTESSYPIFYSVGGQKYSSIRDGGPFSCNYMPIIEDDNARKALAFWREGLKLEHIHAGYSFLSFYKVIESQFTKGKEKGEWVNSAIEDLDQKALERVREIKKGNGNVGMHLFKSGRCAISHASLDDEFIDPDIPEDKIRIQKDLVVIKALAEKFIKEELYIPTHMDVFRKRDRLKPFYEYLGDNSKKLISEKDLSALDNIQIDGENVAINIWPNEPFVPLSDLNFYAVSGDNRYLNLIAVNETKTICLSFVFDFEECKAHTNLDQSGCLPFENGGTADDEIAYKEYFKEVICNSIVEIRLPNKRKIQCEVVIPVNIDLGRSCASIDERIEFLKSKIVE